MKKIIFLLLFISKIAGAQNPLITKTISNIEFQKDTVKSVFDWVTDNIRYDVKKATKLMEEKRPANKKTKTKPKSREEIKQKKIEKVINSQRGVCEDYSLLFDEVLKQLGYESHIVRGYTKTPSGKIQHKIGHTWNAVKVQGIWKLYDPTWGAGYIKDEKRFVKKYNKLWFETSSEEMIKTHMPYDPIWQLLENPIAYNNFKEAGLDSSGKGEFDFEGIIESHFKKERKEQIQDEIARSEAMGAGISLVKKWRKALLKGIGAQKRNNQATEFNEASGKMRNVTEGYNEYIKAKRKRFKDKKWTVDYSRERLIEMKEQTQSAIEVFSNMKVDGKRKKTLRKTLGQTEDILEYIEKELYFLDKP